MLLPVSIIEEILDAAMGAHANYQGEWTNLKSHSPELAASMVNAVADRLWKIVSDKSWENDRIQFSRLIAEVQEAGGFNPEMIEQLATSMDLSIRDVGKLIARACDDWDKLKEMLPGKL
jgi:ABC-type hemin transport system ATPase subunit